MRTSTRKRFCLLAAVSMVMAGWPLLEVTSASAEPAGVHRAGTTVPAAPTIAPTAPVVARATATPAPEDSLTGDITFSVPSGTFSGQLSVQLGTTVENAEIRYTTDGSVPVATSSLSSGSGVAVTKTTQVRAQAFVGGTATGAMGTAIYVARGINATHDLPLVVMDAYGGGKPAREYKDVSVMVMDASGGTSSLAQTPTLTTRGGFHLRGQSSANFDKAPYRVEFWNNKNKDADLPVLGMPADSDWILRGPFPDKSLIREAFAYTLGRDIGIAAPRFAFVELYLNLDNSPMAANDYQGVYMFIENIKRSPDRVNIAKLKKTQLKEPEISGGYVLQFNLMSAEPPTLTCTGGTAQAPCWKDLEVKEPEELQPAQQTWITNYVQKFHDALHGPNPSNTQTGYPAYIDVDSFVNMIIVNEVAREGDSYLRSTHFYKDRGGKILAGPLWDYDLGFNSLPGFSVVDGWQYKPQSGMFGTTSDWFEKLMADPVFLAKVKDRWAVLRQGALSDTQMQARVQAISGPLTNAATRNFQRWPNLNTATVGGFPTQTSQTWQQQVQILQDFLVKRTAWLNSGNGWGGGTPTPTGPTPTVTPTGQGCTAAYAMTNQWDGGFQAEIKVTAGVAAIKGWKVTWTFTNGQTVSQSWNTKITTSGNSVTAANVEHNGALSPGGSTTFGLLGSWNNGTGISDLACTAS
ncbi:MAG: hypothetical protein QG622_2264 [Actinomycetota bacterium]|nr:hypothetical protein [Actinomycetota bacterium]